MTNYQPIGQDNWLTKRQSEFPSRSDESSAKISQLKRPLIHICSTVGWFNLDQLHQAVFLKEQFARLFMSNYRSFQYFNCRPWFRTFTVECAKQIFFWKIYESALLRKQVVTMIRQPLKQLFEACLIMKTAMIFSNWMYIVQLLYYICIILVYIRMEEKSSRVHRGR